MQTKHYSLLLETVALLLTGMSAHAAEPRDFPEHVQFELGGSNFAAGDSITIKEVRGTSSLISPGNTYCVTGTYVLNSEAEAALSLFATTTNKQPTAIDPQQTIRVIRGAGSFRLIKTVAEDGYLHVTFYSASGQRSGGVYFGQGKWVLHNYPGEISNKSHKESSASGQSSSEPNRTLFQYLGNPVKPPPNMDAAYSKNGLAQAMQSAAQSAGISLKKVWIDDSEYPFLVGIVFEKPADKEKLKAEIGKLRAYELQGGIDDDTSCAINIVPVRVFPPETSQRIYRRLMLREAVLYDKIKERL